MSKATVCVPDERHRAQLEELGAVTPDHGAVRLTNLGAGLQAHKSHGVLEVAGVQGDVRLDSEHGSRSLGDIDGSVEIREVRPM